MSGNRFLELLLRNAAELKKYYENATDYVKRIKIVARKHDPKARVLLFGSFVKGLMRPNSDIDVLVVTELAKSVKNRLKLRVEVAREIGEYTPFEIHIVTPEEFKSWYSRFLNKYLEV